MFDDFGHAWIFRTDACDVVVAHRRLDSTEKSGTLTGIASWMTPQHLLFPVIRYGLKQVPNRQRSHRSCVVMSDGDLLSQQQTLE